MKIALVFFLVMQCVKPSIPSNSRIIYPRTDQVRYTHATTLYLACQQGHLLTGSPIMVCNYTTWLKREFKCIGMFTPVQNSLPLSDPFHIAHAILWETMTKSDVWFTWASPEKSFLAPHFRGSVASSEKVVYKNGCKLSISVLREFWFHFSDPKRNENLFFKDSFVVFHCTLFII